MRGRRQPERTPWLVTGCRDGVPERPGCCRQVHDSSPLTQPGADIARPASDLPRPTLRTVLLFIAKFTVLLQCYDLFRQYM